MQMRQKITVGEITPTIQENHDMLFIDHHRDCWQLVYFIGFIKRPLLGKLAAWLLFHPNGGFQMRLISLNVPIYLDVLTTED
jgi:hypothetical protein